MSFAEVWGGGGQDIIDPFFTRDAFEFLEVFDALYWRLHRWGGKPPRLALGAEAFMAITHGFLGNKMASAVIAGTVYESPVIVTSDSRLVRLLSNKNGRRIEFTAELDIEA